MPPRQMSADRLDRTRPSICARAHRPASPRDPAAATGENHRLAQTSAAFNAPGRATSVSPRGHAAAAGERRQSLERTSRCASALPCLPAEHRRGIGEPHRRIAPLRHAAMPPQQANADNRSNAHRAARRDALPCRPAEHRRGIGEPRGRAYQRAQTHRPASPRGHAAAAGERRLARANAAFDMRTDASPRFTTRPCRRGRRTPTTARTHIALRFGAPLSPRRIGEPHRRIAPIRHAAMPPRQANADNRLSAHRPALWCSRRAPPRNRRTAQTRLSTPPGASPDSQRGHAAAIGERRQPLERTSRCASALPQNTAAESAERPSRETSLPLLKYAWTRTQLAWRVFSAPGKFEHLPNMRL